MKNKTENKKHSKNSGNKSVSTYQMFILKQAYREFNNRSWLFDFGQLTHWIWLLKGILSVISFASAYYFMQTFVIKYSPFELAAMVVTIISIVALVVVEAVSYFSGDKMFKHLLFSNRSVAKILIAALLFTASYGTSFFTSTTGGAIKESGTVDKTAEIKKLYRTKLEATENEFEGQIVKLESAIEKIESNPLGWSPAGARTVVDETQSETIAGYQKDIMQLKQTKREAIAEIEANEKAELTQNDIETTASASNEYAVISFILLLQIVFSFGRQYIKYQMYKEAHGLEAEQNEFTVMVHDIGNSVDNVFRSVMEQKRLQFEQYIEHLKLTTALPDIQKTIPLEAKTEEPKRNKIFGFMNKNKGTNNVQASTDKVPTNSVTNSVHEGTNSVHDLTDSELMGYLKKKVVRCENCGEPLLKTKINHRFCSENCRIRNWEKVNGKDLHYKK